jgi:ArsR family transcriptional regulator
MRLQILCRLLDGELAVAGFESELGLKQPNLSQQLGHLREAELVTTRREAKSIYYRLSDERVRVILDALRRVMGTAGAGAPKPATRPAERPSVRSAVSARTPAPTPEFAGCGVFSTAGWPNAHRQRNRIRD